MGTSYLSNEIDSVKLPSQASVGITGMDLAWYDSATGYPKKASVRTDLGSAALNQQDFAKVFCGFFAATRQSTQTDTTPQVIITECDASVTVASATYNHGDLLGVARDSGNSVNYNQTFVRVTDPDAAIGEVIGYYGSATTQVNARFKVRNLASLPPFKAKSYRRVVAKTADYTLIPSDAGTTFTNQGAAGAVVFTLPALASVDANFSAKFFIEADQNVTVTAPSGKLVTFNNATATSIAFSTSSEKIGAEVEVYMNADLSKYLCSIRAQETATPTVA